MKLFQVLIALFFTAALLSGCNNADESAPATDAAPETTEPAAPAADAAAPAEPAPAAEPASEEPGGWVPPAEGS